jgi:hypothetical protein
MADDGEPEVLDLGLLDEPDADRPDTDPRPGHAAGDVSRRRLLTLAGVLAVAGGVGALQSGRSSSPLPELSAEAVPLPVRATRWQPAAPPPQVAVIDLRRPLLGGPRWDLFALGDTIVVRVEFATGRITQTLLGPLGNLELSLVPVRRGVVVHRADYRPGYAVPDGGPARLTPPGLDGPGPMLPGPDLDHVWVQAGSGDTARMVLATSDGRVTPVSVALPTYPTFDPMPDGGGYPLFGAVGGFYRGVPGAQQHITAGVVVAGGAYGWLAVECDDRDRCGAVLVDRHGRRRAVPGIADPRVPSGVLAPDGRTAAVYVMGAPATLIVTLVDLVDGRRRSVGMVVGEGQGVSSLAWSPDSRWLFAVDASARLLAVDVRTARARLLVPELPGVRQIALRAA